MRLDRITPIILAAGDSARMGFPKALLPIGQDTFISRILNTLEHVGMKGTTVVLGSHAGQIEPRIRDRRVRVIVNPRPSDGQLSSIKLALSTLDPASEACMLWPVDQPGISETLVRTLILKFASSNAHLALPQCRERRGHPAVLRRLLFQEIMDTPLQEGLKPLVLRHQPDMALLPTDESAVIEDIDTPEDYFHLTGIRLEEALGISRAND
ncbi:MAG TPA: nucleotidyltransferase family protein [Acidobacteriota bacterium]|nr:nucleotidyltransferase family protein [Acidobacteriota bacterium]